MLLENSSARVFAILQAIFKGMASHGLPPSRSASPFAAGGHQPGLNGLSKGGLVSLLPLCQPCSGLSEGLVLPI